MKSLLFSPITLGKRTLVNRLVVAPMCQYSAQDGAATDWHFQHLSQLGYSGAGLVMLEATAVERRGRISHRCLGLYSDGCAAALADVMAKVRRLSGPTQFGIQLAHAGRKASTHIPWAAEHGPLKPGEDPWITVAPSPIPFDSHWHTPAALDHHGLETVIQSFMQAARRAVAIGFDAIEIHATHGYLLHQFLSPLSNHRTDEFGGNLENAMRFPLQVVTAVRTVVPPEIILGVRITGTDWADGGWTLENAVEFARCLKAIGIDYADVSSGGLVPHANIPVAPNYQVSLAEAVKKQSGIEPRAVGMIATPQQAEDIIASGQADMVAMARAFMDDPRWGWHAAETLGATDQIARHCPPQYQRAMRGSWPGAALVRPLPS